MGLIGGQLGYFVLRLISSDGRGSSCDGSVYQNRSKIEVLFGSEIWAALAGKVVLDYGCGVGDEAIEIAQKGAARVIGLDIRKDVLTKGKQAAAASGVGNRCYFTAHFSDRVDVILSLDAFEHFEDPAQVLREMRKLLKDDGCVIIEFGPSWYHPLGGHLFSVFPWAHLLFTEKALIRWRSDFKTDGATRFCEVEGGLNQMTIRRFKEIVAQSDFRFASFEAVPIRRLRLVANRFTREFTTAIVRCRLVPADA
ncbi:MAG TPA: methyltransferase domain-containing protein [Pyrinomonadaceae bacterium]|nr:methyltransferase domain-containing protein [Pyrinomonadaceae bacterium]